MVINYSNSKQASTTVRGYVNKNPNNAWPIFHFMSS